MAVQITYEQAPGVANKALEQMKHFYAEYGLTPSARTKLRIMTTIIDQPAKSDNNKTDSPPTKPHQPAPETIMDEIIGDMDGGYVKGSGGRA